MVTSSNGNIFCVTGLCVGNSPVIGEFPAQRPVTRSFDFFLWSTPWINGWVNHREAGDLRRHGAHYDVTVIWDNSSVCHCYWSKFDYPCSHRNGKIVIMTTSSTTNDDKSPEWRLSVSVTSKQPWRIRKSRSLTSAKNHQIQLKNYLSNI